jgi:hypothetical protein
LFLFFGLEGVLLEFVRCVDAEVTAIGSPALSMTAATRWLRTNEKRLENADRGGG